MIIYDVLIICRQTDISMNLILQDDNTSHNILIEGNPGSGKTLMCERLAWQWANNKPDMEGLCSFDLLFIIRLSLIKPGDQTIYDYIHRELLEDRRDIQRLVERMNMRVLILLDGYDELKCDDKVVRELLQKKNSPLATVMLTTRATNIIALYKYFTDMFRIDDLSLDDIEPALSKITNTRRHVELQGHPLASILTTPMFLCFSKFSYLKSGNFHISSSTRTHLFKVTINKLMDKVSRSMNTDSETIELALVELRKMAYQCTRHNRLHFKQRLSHVAANIGLVKQPMTHLNAERNTSYIFCHKSIAEFLAAQFIVSQYDLRNSLAKIQNLKKTTTRQTSLLLFFVCGLLHDRPKIDSLYELSFSTRQPMNQQITELELLDNQPNCATHHFGLQCLAELKPELISDNWVHCVPDVLSLDTSQCSQYCILGLHRVVHQMPDLKYPLKDLTLTIKDVNLMNLFENHVVLNEVSSLADHNHVTVEDVPSSDTWTTLSDIYRDVCVDQIIVNG